MVADEIAHPHFQFRCQECSGRGLSIGLRQFRCSGVRILFHEDLRCGFGSVMIERSLRPHDGSTLVGSRCGVLIDCRDRAVESRQGRRRDVLLQQSW